MADTSSRGLGSPSIDPKKKHDIQSKGGQASSSQQDMSTLGQKGGQAAQQSGNAHKLNNEDRSKGGQNSPTNFTTGNTEEFDNTASMSGSTTGNEIDDQ
ncbi:MAG TPA: hypothetical protein VLG67_03575 [Candidatus Saccharimonadales bacterium]|nr:hypothetical protein [Candidatus Saccharimonadales bacterium]